MTALQMTSVGDNVVDLYRESRTQFPGGGAANVAVQASRLGWKAYYVGIIGSDFAGEFITNSLRAEGVALDGSIWSDEPNAITEVEVDSSGNRRFSGWSPPDRELVLTSIAQKAIRESEWVYTNYSSRAEHLLPEIANIAPVAFDFSYKDQEYARQLLPYVSVAAFSRESLDDQSIVDLIRWTQQNGAATVVITRGAGGAVVASGAEIHVQPSYPVNVVDTLGAGDSFLARFICERGRGASLRIAAELATATAASTCTELGAFGHGEPIGIR